MAIPTPALPQIGRSWKAQIVNGTGTGLLTIATPSASFSFAKITGLIATNSDAVNAYAVTFGVSRGGTFFPLATVSVPANAGYTIGAPPVNLMSALSGIVPTDADQVGYFLLEQANADTLQAQVSVAVTSGKAVSLHAVGGEY